jgi:hypothetical protein
MRVSCPQEGHAGAVVAIAVVGLLACAHASIATSTARGMQRQTPADKEALDRESRAFWNEPSLRRLVNVGFAMEQALLSSELVEREMMDGRPRRPQNADFEAMKARLAKGVVVNARTLPALPPAYEPIAKAMKRATLPQTRLSYFRHDEQPYAIALRPFGLDSSEDGVGLADALSAIQKIPLKVERFEPVVAGNFRPLGVWDISEADVRFGTEAIVHAVSTNGVGTGFTISSMRVSLGNQPCGNGGATIEGRPMNGSWMSAAVAWVGKAAPATKATVTTRTLGGSGRYDKLTIETIDLDGDRVPDLSIWGGVEPPVVTVETYWKAVFVNVGGKWLLLGFNQEADCT